MREHLADPLPEHADVQFLAGTVDVVVAALTGILVDGLLVRGFDAINHLDLGVWLARHGAEVDHERPDRNSVFLRGVYDGSFAFVDGDPNRPNMAAGRALQGAIRCLFHYNGSVLWRMQAGMGDAVIAPLYEVLRARGVRFAFFHAVEEVRPTPDGARVGEIAIVPQVDVRDGDYEPLINVDHDGKPLPCWPSEPRYEQLVGGHSSKVRGADFEHVDRPAEAGRAHHARGRPGLRRGHPRRPAARAGGGLRPAAQGQPALRRNARRLRDGDHPGGAALARPHARAELGQGWDSNSLMSMFVEPLDTYCDMSHLLAGEHWPARLDVRHVAYFCGVIPHEQVDAATDPEGEARTHTRMLLENHAHRFWPNTVGARGRGFDWTRLVGPAAVAGTARLKSQYFRVNHQPSERYVLTLADSVESRLWPKERCFDNLVFAGDWTRNGFDCGCVEAAMTSGMLAASAISGFPAESAIAGVHGPSGFPEPARGWRPGRRRAVPAAVRGACRRRGGLGLAEGRAPARAGRRLIAQERHGRGPRVAFVTLAPCRSRRTSSSRAPSAP